MSITEKEEEKVKVCYSKNPLSFDELEEFRDEEGFIDLEQADLIIAEGSRNQIGSADIFKYWVDFAGTKVLLKQEKMLGGERNGTLYSELIMNALCETMRIRSAKTDVFKLGKFRGIISHLAFDPEKECMMMIKELIGEIPSDGDTYDFKTVEDNIRRELTRQYGLSEKEVEEYILKRRLQKILQLYSSEMDNHLENEAFLFRKTEDGKYHIRTCPMFDNELSFGLHATFSEMTSDSIYDNLQIPDRKQLFSSYNKILNHEELSDDEIKTLEQFSDDKQIRDILIGNTHLRDRILGDGKQVVLDTKAMPKFYSKSDATIYYLYKESINALENQELDDDIAELHETIIDFIEDLKDLDMQDIIDEVEERVSIPLTIKTSLIRFSRMKSNVINFAIEGIGEVEFYEKMADTLVKEREKRAKRDKNKGQEIE